jgi:hypothetical protein
MFVLKNPFPSIALLFGPGVSEQQRDPLVSTARRAWDGFVRPSGVHDHFLSPRDGDGEGVDIEFGVVRFFPPASVASDVGASPAREDDHLGHCVELPSLGIAF